MSRILIAGSPVVGRHVLERLLADDRWTQVVRYPRPLASHPNW